TSKSHLSEARFGKVRNISHGGGACQDAQPIYQRLINCVYSSCKAFLESFHLTDHCESAIQLLNSPPPSLAPLIPLSLCSAKIELIDLRIRLLWDTEAIVESVHRTKKLAIVHEAGMAGGVGVSQPRRSSRSLTCQMKSGFWMKLLRRSAAEVANLRCSY
ncbi:hypothetical protein AZE42_07026, partial [Rhizopogon vesiculosus]